MNLENNNLGQEDSKISTKNKLKAAGLFLLSFGMIFYLVAPAVQQMAVRDKIRGIGFCLKKEASEQRTGGNKKSLYDLLLEIDEGRVKSDCGYSALTNEQKIDLFSDLRKDEKISRQGLY